MTYRFVSALLTVFVTLLTLAPLAAQAEDSSGKDSSFWPKAGEKDTRATAEKQKAQVEAIVTGIRERYRKDPAWRCPFNQEYKSKLTKRTTKSDGKVLFEQPTNMRWDYDKPEKKSFITDGKQMWYVLWDAKEAKHNPTLKKSSLESSIGFLWGESDLRADYDILLLPLTVLEKDIQVGERLALELTPKKSSQFEVLYLLVNPTSYRIEEAVLIDTIGNRNRLIFGKQEVMKKQTPTPFVWSQPKGETWQVETVSF